MEIIPHSRISVFSEAEQRAVCDVLEKFDRWGNWQLEDETLAYRESGRRIDFLDLLNCTGTEGVLGLILHVLRHYDADDLKDCVCALDAIFDLRRLIDHPSLNNKATARIDPEAILRVRADRTNKLAARQRARVGTARTKRNH